MLIKNVEIHLKEIRKSAKFVIVVFASIFAKGKKINQQQRV